MFAFVDPFRRDDGPRANIITKTNGPTLSTIRSFPPPRSHRHPPLARSPEGIFIRTRIDGQNRGRWLLRRREDSFFFSRMRLPKLSYMEYRILIIVIHSRNHHAILANNAFRDDYRRQISGDTLYQRMVYRYGSSVIVSSCRDTVINSSS